MGTRRVHRSRLSNIQTAWSAILPWLVGAGLLACDADSTECPQSESGAGNASSTPVVCNGGVINNDHILLGNGSVCASGTDCSSGFCVDGVCCSSECTGTCEACTRAKKGNGEDGDCGPIAIATDPDDECTPGYCDGMLGCGLSFGVSPNGTACESAAECASVHCVDGVCCDTECTGTCMACTATTKGSGTNGVCGPIADKTDPDLECSFAYCNGLGACGEWIPLGNGSTCNKDWECSSGFCVDGVCCDAACTGTCMACTAATKGSGTNGVCGPIAAATDPDNECLPGDCNGMGACPVLDGPPCNNSQCCGLPIPANIGAAQGFIDVGHPTILSDLIQSGDRVLSHGYFYERWILWDTTTRMAVADGLSSPSGYVGLAGNLVIIQTEMGLDLRNATTGQLQATIAGAPSSFAQIGIADDGSYAWAAPANGGLKAWSAQGTEVVNVMGDYSNASVFAAPAEIRVAKGPAGANRIETLPIGGQPQLSPTFAQDFHSWMVDGERFFAVVDKTVFIYSKQAALVTSATLPTIESLAGTGNRFWTFQGSTPGYPLRVYNTSSAAMPVVTYNYGVFTELFPSKQGLGILPNNRKEIHFIHLDPQATQEVIPIPIHNPYHVAVDGITGFWTVANVNGAIYQQGTSLNPQAQGTLGCGAVLEVAGTPTGWAAIALASKRLLIFDMNAGGVVKKELPVFAEKIAMSNDHSILATWTEHDEPRWRIDLFSLPTGNEIHQFANSQAFSLAGNGQHVGITKNISMGQVTDISGTLTFFGGNTSFHPPLPSPNGSFIAAPDGMDGPQIGTNLYLANPMGGTPTFINAVPGRVVGWIDDNRMLAYTLDYGGPPSYKDVYDKTLIYDALGTIVATPDIPEKLDEFDLVSASAIYSPQQRKVYDLTTGATLWTSPLEGTKSAAAGNRAIMVHDSAVYVVPF